MKPFGLAFIQFQCLCMEDRSVMPIRFAAVSCGMIGLALACSAAGPRGLSADAPQRQVVRYMPSAEAFANPERGFYAGGGHCERQPFQVEQLRTLRADSGIALAICVFYLERYKLAPIDQATLDFLERQLNAIRSAGAKVILRFAYADVPGESDADPGRVIGHIAQLAPLFRRHQDIILTVQEGFVGTWGEGALSQHFGVTPHLSEADRQARGLVRSALLAALPASRMLQVRTPLLKTMLSGAHALSSTDAYSGRPAARTGYFNDCFLHGESDSGTYLDAAREPAYVAAETRFLPMGGETCGRTPPRTDCRSALRELARFHWTYLNSTYHPAVLEAWRDQGCLPEIGKRLGYRFVMTEGTFPRSARAGRALRFSVSLRNEGWAAPFNFRPVYVVLQAWPKGRSIAIPLRADPRFWSAGAPYRLVADVPLPEDLTAGPYALRLWLPDAADGLKDRPEYAIRFANQGAWDAASGQNRLFSLVEILPATRR